MVFFFIFRYGFIPLLCFLAALALFEWACDKIADWRVTR